MTMLLQWRQLLPPITTRWRGPEGQVLPVLAITEPTSLPTLIGPPGISGPSGPQGVAGPAYDLNSAVIDGGEFT
jgi:hypothetical protein